MNANEIIYNDIAPVFGIEGFEAALRAPHVSALLASARERAAAAAAAPIERIIEILDKLADIWGDIDHPLRKTAQSELPAIIGFHPKMVSLGLDVVADLCRRSSTTARIRGELGDIAVLDGWKTPANSSNKPADPISAYRYNFEYDLRAFPRGVVLHLAAGNVFVGAADSLIAGILTKNVNILKMSHADPLFPLLFLKSLKEADPEGLVWPKQAVVIWKGGDEQVEKQLFEAGITIVFWGGREALAAVRASIGLDTKLIENGPRYSFAVTDAETIARGMSKDALAGLARDICLWDQQACSSPHSLYIIGGSENDAYTLMNNMVSHLNELTLELPPGPLEFDEKVEIRRVRELAAMGEAKGSARLLCPETFEWTLIYEANPAFKISCLHRTLFVKTVPDIERLAAETAPLAEYLQTVGINVSSNLRSKLEEALLRNGAKRLTEFGGMSEGKNGAPHEGSFLLSQLVDFVDVEHKNIEERLLRDLFQTLKKSSYYKPLVEAAEKHVDLRERLAAIPLLDRETFYRCSPPHSNAILTGPLSDAYVYASGGTTGEPKFSLYSNDDYRTSTDILGFIYSAAGLGPEDRVGNLFLAGNLWTSFNVAGRALENIGCLNMPIGGATDYALMIKYLQAFCADAVVGLPSIIVKLAEEVERIGAALQIQKVLYGGEHMRPQTVDFLKRVLGCKFVRSAGYACVDTGPIGYQCRYLEGSLHHVLQGYQIVEILDAETGELINDERPGEIVTTCLARRLMPVVRYRTGDMGRWIEPKNGAECPCGYRGQTFELLGRCDDLLVVGGINLLPSDIASGLSQLPVSQNFQIVARSKQVTDLLILRLEAEKPLESDKVLEALKRGSYKIASALESGRLEIEMEWFTPGTLPRNPRTGKIKTVLDERGY